MRAVYVTEDERLVGVVTRKTLVREVVAPGLDPKATELGLIAEAPHFTIGPDIPLEEAFRFLETEDAERVPVVDEHERWSACSPEASCSAGLPRTRRTSLFLPPRSAS